MKYLVAVVFLLFFAMPARAEIFMYKDSSGTWYGVDKIEKVPPEYRNQVEKVVHTERPLTPEEKKAKDERKRLEDADQAKKKRDDDAFRNSLKKEEQDRQAKDKKNPPGMPGNNKTPPQMPGSKPQTGGTNRTQGTDQFNKSGGF